jgi:lipopolysaccharide transport system ATP-binding protein
VRGLAKSYRIGAVGDSNPTLSDVVGERLRHPLRRAPKETFWALNDVSFDVRPGEVLGVIGRNGAGKSTLLKILSRITEPTAGEAHVYGRVGSLLEVGTGFHPELTGRENIYLNGAILGMRRRQIDRMFDAIVDFSGIGKFLETPVKRYSSGMYVRLAFAVAAHIEPEILIVDEVLAVGDASFQQKCLGKMSDLSANDGRTLIFVSHNLAAIQTLCDRCIVIDGGRVLFDGDTSTAVGHYLSVLNTGSAVVPGVADLSARDDVSDDRALFRRLTLLGEDGQVTDTFRMGEAFSMVVDVEGLSDIPLATVGAWLKTELEQPVASLNLAMKPPQAGARSRAEQIVLRIPALPLTPGDYWIGLQVKERGDHRLIDGVGRAIRFTVLESDVYGSGYKFRPGEGLVWVDHEWEIRPQGEPTRRAPRRAPQAITP